MRKKLSILILAVIAYFLGFAYNNLAFSNRLQDIWHNGDTELYFSGYAWHNRSFYQRARRKHLNELAWGVGIGKGWYTNKSDWYGLSAVVFSDSHRCLEPTLGYTYLRTKAINADVSLGLGATFLITSRADVWHRIPFPGALPWLSLTIRSVTLSTTYIPGHQNVGNVLFVIGKLTLG